MENVLFHLECDFHACLWTMKRLKLVCFFAPRYNFFFPSFVFVLVWNSSFSSECCCRLVYRTQSVTAVPQTVRWWELGLSASQVVPKSSLSGSVHGGEWWCWEVELIGYSSGLPLGISHAFLLWEAVRRFHSGSFPSCTPQVKPENNSLNRSTDHTPSTWSL